MIGADTVLYPVILKIPPDHQIPGHQIADRRKKVQNLSLLARRALLRSCALSGLFLADFPKAENGAPVPVGGVHWSLSHKPEVAGGVAANVPIGMDLETIRPVHPGLFSHAADAAEWALFPDGKNQMNFFRVWTAKEAVIKAEGIGFAGISRCRVQSVIDDIRMTLVFDQTPWPVRHHWFGDHVAAVTVPPGFTVCWRILEQIPDAVSPEPSSSR